MLERYPPEKIDAPPQTFHSPLKDLVKTEKAGFLSLAEKTKEKATDFFITSPLKILKYCKEKPDARPSW